MLLILQSPFLTIWFDRSILVDTRVIIINNYLLPSRRKTRIWAKTVAAGGRCRRSARRRSARTCILPSRTTGAAGPRRRRSPRRRRRHRHSQPVATGAAAPRRPTGRRLGRPANRRPLAASRASPDFRPSKRTPGKRALRWSRFARDTTRRAANSSGPGDKKKIVAPDRKKNDERTRRRTARVKFSNRNARGNGLVSTDDGDARVPTRITYGRRDTHWTGRSVGFTPRSRCYSCVRQPFLPPQRLVCRGGGGSCLPPHAYAEMWSRRTAAASARRVVVVRVRVSYIGARHYRRIQSVPGNCSPHRVRERRYFPYETVVPRTEVGNRRTSSVVVWSRDEPKASALSERESRVSVRAEIFCTDGRSLPFWVHDGIGLLECATAANVNKREHCVSRLFALDNWLDGFSFSVCRTRIVGI